MVPIERATADDLPDVLALVAACDLTVEGLADHIATVLVARSGGTVVGTATVEMYSDGALLRSVAVDPAFRRQRIGHRLVEESMAMASGAGVPAVYLLTITAERYFPRFGFVRIDRAQVPAGVQRSAQFTHACPPSSIVMCRVFPRRDGGVTECRG